MKTRFFCASVAVLLFCASCFASGFYTVGRGASNNGIVSATLITGSTSAVEDDCPPVRTVHINPMLGGGLGVLRFSPDGNPHVYINRRPLLVECGKEKPSISEIECFEEAVFPEIGEIECFALFPEIGEIECPFIKPTIGEIECPESFDCAKIWPAADVNTVGNGRAVEFTISGQTQTWLTYNLGADPMLTPYQQMTYVSTAPSGDLPFNARVLGGFFQWGRSDYRSSFRCQWEGSSDTRFSYNTTSDNEADFDGKYALVSGNNPGDWRTTQDDALWTGSGGTNNVCPTGFHVPTRAEIDLFWHEYTNHTAYRWVPVQDGVINSLFSDEIDRDAQWNFLSINTGMAIYTVADYNALVSAADGVDLKLASSWTDNVRRSPLLYLPAAGFRNGLNTDGYVSLTGYAGYYWTSESLFEPGRGNINKISGFWSDYPIYTEEIPDLFYGQNGMFRYNGLSVRCMQ
jgi:hypothetical protein